MESKTRDMNLNKSSEFLETIITPYSTKMGSNTREMHLEEFVWNS
jgi:hypothetical protein